MQAVGFLVAVACLWAVPVHAQGTGQGGCYFGQGPGCGTPSKSTAPTAPTAGGLQCSQNSAETTSCGFTPTKSGMHRIRAKLAVLKVNARTGFSAQQDLYVDGKRCVGLRAIAVSPCERVVIREMCYAERDGKPDSSEFECLVWLNQGARSTIEASVGKVEGAIAAGVTVIVTDASH